MNKVEFETLIGNCFSELEKASKEKYDAEKAERTAALFLTAQMQLAFFIEDIELNSRHLKNEIERIEAEKYFDAKTSIADGKKATEGYLTQSIAKDKDVSAAKKAAAAAEADLNKSKYLMSSLKDAHIYFRNLSKNKDWE